MDASDCARTDGQRFGVRLSLASIGVVLARQGLTPQKPWQRETYPALARHAQRTKAEISFWDESGVRADAVALTGLLFLDVLRRMLRGRRKPLHLILDGLPTHKALAVKKYVAGLAGKLTVHYLPGYAPDLNPDELVGSHATRTGNARRPLQQGDRLADRITAPLAEMKRRPALVRSFFRHPSVADIAAC